jgi:hypothetical protein
MSASYYKPWISDEEPKAPENWGLDVFRGRVENFKCGFCHKPIQFREEYIYNFDIGKPGILHNTEECTRDLRP